MLLVRNPIPTIIVCPLEIVSGSWFYVLDGMTGMVRCYVYE